MNEYNNIIHFIYNHLQYEKYIYILSQVVEGYETLAKLEAINTQNQRPLKECKIVECGSYKFEF